MNDRRYPWLILVPRYNDLSEIHDLRDKDQSTLISEVTAATRALEKLFQPEKINVAALGNLVSQLHIHVIARFEEDEAWPNPVWGIGKNVIYPKNEVKPLVNQLTTALLA
jgi:diadenosine tetraphosphate (Ap4A) HIT family hydrolase